MSYPFGYLQELTLFIFQCTNFFSFAVPLLEQLVYYSIFRWACQYLFLNFFKKFWGIVCSSKQLYLYQAAAKCRTDPKLFPSYYLNFFSLPSLADSYIILPQQITFVNTFFLIFLLLCIFLIDIRQSILFNVHFTLILFSLHIL